MSTLAIHNEQSVPSMTVFELAVSAALARRASPHDEEVLSLLGWWFLSNVDGVHVRLALDRMEQNGWVVRGRGIGDAILTESGIDVLARLTGGCIRMIDRGTNSMKANVLQGIARNLGKETGDE